LASLKGRGLFDSGQEGTAGRKPGANGFSVT
jgi:hypothetical protein